MKRPCLPQLAALLLTIAMLAGCDRPPRIYRGEFPAFGAKVEVSLAGLGKGQAEAAIRLVEMDLRRMEGDWHVRNPSPLKYANQMLRLGDNTFKCPADLIPVIQEGQRLARLSDQLFNPAIGDLIAAWGLHEGDPAKRSQPPKEEIERLVAANPRMDDIHIRRARISSANPAVQLDLGAYAKGYALDQATKKLQEIGVPSAFISADGVYRAYGTKGEEPWQVAVRDPFRSAPIGYIPLQQAEAAAASGDSEADGRRLPHLIDPRTGYPAKGTRTVMVLHPNAATAAAAADALFVAGPGEWHRIARRMELRYVLLIDDEGWLHMSPEMKGRLRLDGMVLPVTLSESLAEAPSSGAPAGLQAAPAEIPPPDAAPAAPQIPAEPPSSTPSDTPAAPTDRRPAG